MTDFDPDAYLQDSSQATSFDPDAYLADDSPKAVKSYDAVNGKLVPTGSPEAKAAQSPTAGMSGYQKFMAGAGKSQIDTARGIGQLVGIEPQADVDAAKARDAPLMQSGAAVAGDIAGNVADVVIPAGLAGQGLRAAGLARTGAVVGGLANPTNFTGAAASGALQGALQPTATGESRTQNAVVGAGSGLVGQGLARGGSAVMSVLAPEDAASKAVTALTQAGVPLDAAQRTGSTLLNRAKAMLSDNPITAGGQADMVDMQNNAFSKAVLKTIGESTNDPGVMNRAMSRMSGVYDDVASRTSIPYDVLEPHLADIENQARLTLNDQQFGVVRRNLDDIMQKAAQNGGTIKGDQFSNIKKTLDGLSTGGDSDVGEVARDIRQTMNNGLLDSAAASGNGTDVALLKQNNTQWGNMRKIEGAVSKDENGNIIISPAKLANVMYQKANRYNSIYGHGDTSLADLADAGRSLLTNKTPNSGSISRLVAQIGAPAAIGAGVEGVREGNWEGAAKGAAAGVAFPWAVQKALNSQGALGQIARGAGNLAKPSSMPALVGGALQHAPLSSILAEKQRLQNSPDTSSPTAGSNQ
jgi:hypothetical protein